jgi:hypothetical protein
MTMPGFTAEASLYGALRTYATRAGRGTGPDGSILPKDLSSCGDCVCPGKGCKDGIFGCKCLPDAEETVNRLRTMRMIS